MCIQHRPQDHCLMSEADMPACRGVLKLCDMGLARFFKPENAAYTPRVVTLW